MWRVFLFFVSLHCLINSAQACKGAKVVAHLVGSTYRDAVVVLTTVHIAVVCVLAVFTELA